MFFLYARSPFSKLSPSFIIFTAPIARYPLKEIKSTLGKDRGKRAPFNKLNQLSKFVPILLICLLVS